MKTGNRIVIARSQRRSLDFARDRLRNPDPTDEAKAAPTPAGLSRLLQCMIAKFAPSPGRAHAQILHSHGGKNPAGARSEKPHGAVMVFAHFGSRLRMFPFHSLPHDRAVKWIPCCLKPPYPPAIKLLKALKNRACNFHENKIALLVRLS